MTKKRENPIEIGKTEFQKIGYQLIDTIAEFFDDISDKPVTTTKTPKELQKILGNLSLPQDGLPAEELVSSTSKLLFDHSLFNGHPKFFGFITSSGAPIGGFSRFVSIFY